MRTGPTQLAVRRRLTLTLIGTLPALGALGACWSDVLTPNSTAGSWREAASISIAPDVPRAMSLVTVTLLRAQVRNADGAVILLASVRWTVSDSSVIRLSAGVGTEQTYLSALRPGTATLTATSGASTASVPIVVVRPGPVASVSLGSPFAVALGGAAQLSAVLRDSVGVALPTALVAYSSSDPTIISVTSSGLIVARKQGVATLSATSNGKTDSRSVLVTAPVHAFTWTRESGMTDLGVVAGFVTSRATAVSGEGHVAGSLWTIGGSFSRAFLRTPGATGVMRALDGLTNAGASEAFGVNGAGQVVGYAIAASGLKRAVLWSADGAIRELGTLDGDDDSEARAINDAGQVVGRSGGRSFIWSAESGMRALDNAPAGTALAINRSGVVVGQSGQHAYVWSAQSGFRDLPVLNADTAATVVGINGLGVMVGASFGCGFYDEEYGECDAVPEHPLLWSTGAADVTTQLRSSAGPGDVISHVAGINDAGQLVGRSSTGRALLWSTTGGLLDLGTLPGHSIGAATAINNAGQVVGWSGTP